MARIVPSRHAALVLCVFLSVFLPITAMAADYVVPGDPGFSGGGFTLNTGDTLTINNTGTITNDTAAAISNYGTITNNAGGSIANENGSDIRNYSGATLTNSGSIANGNGGIITNDLGATLTNSGTIMSEDWGSVDNYGTFVNTGTITGQNDGYLYNYSGGTLNNSGIITNDNSTFANYGTITNQAGGTITNEGHGYIFNHTGATFTNNGTITNNRGFIYNNFGGTFTNNATITNDDSINNYGTLNNDAGGTITNRNGGYIKTHSGGTFTNNGTITNDTSSYVHNHSGGTFTNNGTITNIGGGTITNYTGATFTNNNTITNNGAFGNGGTLNNAGAFTNSGALNNAGAFTNSGTLNNTSAFTNSGTLNNAGAFMNNGAITNDNGDVYNFSGATLTNSGTMTNNSGGIYNYGTLTNNAGGTITNQNSGVIRNFSGGAFTNSGTFTNNGTFTNHTSNIKNNATMTNNAGGTLRNQNGGYILNSSGAALTNYGTFTNEAGGDLDNQGTFTNSGTFTNDGTFTNSGTFTNDGTFKGAGTFVGTFTNDSILAPGNSIGTITVVGDYIHAAGATYEVEVNAAGQSDKVIVTGTATLNGGTVSVLAESGAYTLSTTYTILTAGNVVGKFDNVTSNLAFLTPSLSYDLTNVYLLLTRNSTNFAAVAGTSNQYAVASALDRTSGGATGDMADVINTLLGMSASGARGAYDRIGGLTHASLPGVIFSSFSRYMGVMSGRMGGFISGGQRSSFASRPVMLASRTDRASDVGNTLMAALGNMAGKTDILSRGLWVEGYGSLGQRRGNNTSSRYDYDMAGLAAGFDRVITPSLLIGASLGYSYTKADMKDLSDSATVSSYQGSLYGIYKVNPFYLSGIAAYGYNRYDTRRDIAFGTISRRAKASYAGHTVGGYIEGGYRMSTPSMDVIPLASLTGIHLMRDGFTERNAGALSLDVDADTTASLVSSLGVRLTKDYRASSGTLTPEVRVTWDHEFMNNDYALDASFAGYPTSTFTVEGDRPDRDSLGARMGVTFQAKENLHLSLAYDGSFSGDNTQHAGTLGLRYRW